VPFALLKENFQVEPRKDLGFRK